MGRAVPRKTPEIAGALKLASGFDKLDPFDEEDSRQLLIPADVVRDPLHGDIWLTALERCIVNSPEFQRLRGINQLGMTYVAYPGAVHTRFLHSLGTLHVCSEIIQTCNKNAESYQRLTPADDPAPLRITPYAQVLARLCALMHDMAHVPFGHTLVKEGRVFENDEWQDSERRNKLKDPNGLTARIRAFLNGMKLDPNAGQRLLEEVWAVLEAQKESIDSLRYPFVHDLVGNTICADLIDYVKRDMYFCGLEERFGDRFVQYLAVIPVTAVTKPEEGKLVEYRVEKAPGDEVFANTEQGDKRHFCKVVLLLYRYNESFKFVVKHDVASEAIDLVRRRLDLAEKLYFHRTKLAASAMLVSAVFDAKLTSMDIWNDTDDEVVRRLAGRGDRAQQLAMKLRTRRIFKPIYVVSYREKNESAASDELWGPHGVYARFEKPAACDKLVRRLESVIGLELGDLPKAIGSVCISCPDSKMNLKAFNMLVLRAPDKPVHRLHDSNHKPTRMEIDAITTAHEHLWRFQVLVDPEIIDLSASSSLAMKLAGAIAHEIGARNEVPEFTEVTPTSLVHWENELRVRAILAEHGVQDKITLAHHTQLMEAVFRTEYRPPGDGNSTVQDLLRADVEKLLKEQTYI